MNKEFKISITLDGNLILDVVPEVDVPDMSNGLKERRTISLDPDVFEIGHKRAREARRSFSNYMEVLIEADARQPETKAAI